MSSFNKTSDFTQEFVSFRLYAFGVVIYALAFFAAMIMFWLVYPKLQPFAEWLHRGFSDKVMRGLQVISAVFGVLALISFLFFA